MTLSLKHCRVCIVSPDVNGPIRNGGIGTHVGYLSRVLTDAGAAVTILHAGPYEVGDGAHWRAHFAEYGIAYRDLSAVRRNEPINASNFEEISRAVLGSLGDDEFTHIHLQDWLATGFRTVQAKRVLGRFANTRITITAHSPTAWVDEGMRQWPDDPVGALKLDWAERYAWRYADMRISPSRYLLEWMRQEGWEGLEDARVMPNCARIEARPVRQFDPSHLAFVGRIETRKGAGLLCDALARLSRLEPGAVRKVDFFGKRGLIDGRPAHDVLAERLRPLRIEYAINDGLDAEGVTQALANSAALPVLPSLQDNFPYAIVERCLAGGAFLAADVGGAREIADSALLFAPTAPALAEALLRARRGELPIRYAHPYDAAQAERGWAELHAEEIEAAPEPPPAQPAVSVCIPFFNAGRFVDETLASLAAQTHAPAEIIVVDDGSDEPASIARFAELPARFSDLPLNCLRQDNAGVGAARNAAAAAATSEFVVFMDADNIATPEMLEEMVRAMHNSGADCLTCSFRAFMDGRALNEIYAYYPLGGAIEPGLFENVMGDANFIIRRSLFTKLGGFRTERTTSWEDWDFLARVALSGAVLDTIAKPLFWYRHLEGGFSRVTNLYQNRRRILRAYEESLPPFAARIARTAAALGEGGTSGGVGARVGARLERIVRRAIPRKSFLFQWAARIGRRIAR